MMGVLGLESEMTYRAATTDLLGPTAGSPLGGRRYWQVSEATLEGARIRARLASTDGDWMTVGADGYW
jgi:hypothetical protein